MSEKELLLCVAGTVVAATVCYFIYNYFYPKSNFDEFSQENLTPQLKNLKGFLDDRLELSAPNMHLADTTFANSHATLLSTDTIDIIEDIPDIKIDWKTYGALYEVEVDVVDEEDGEWGQDTVTFYFPNGPDTVLMMEFDVPTGSDNPWGPGDPEIILEPTADWIETLQIMLGDNCYSFILATFAFIYPTFMARPLYFQLMDNMWIFNKIHIKAFQPYLNLKDVKEEEIPLMERVLPMTLYPKIKVCKALLFHQSSNKMKMNFPSNNRNPLWKDSGELDESVAYDASALKRALLALPPEVKTPIIKAQDLPKNINNKTVDERTILDKLAAKYDKMIIEIDPSEAPEVLDIIRLPSAPIPPIKYKDIVYNFIKYCYESCKYLFIFHIWPWVSFLFLLFIVAPLYIFIYSPIVNLPWFITKYVPYWWNYRLKHEKQLSWKQLFAIFISTLAVTVFILKTFYP